MDEIKFVIDELNQPPFNSSLNLIAYDGLRSEQRLDLLTAVLNTIDPKVCWKKLLVGGMTTNATILFPFCW